VCGSQEENEREFLNWEGTWTYRSSTLLGPLVTLQELRKRKGGFKKGFLTYIPRVDRKARYITQDKEW
jgi:hypothetical protein